ncbi:hypothetical protein C8R44DRAFT_48563 [Mycena epipterygia]|nr:hypothetical protein C8R44DRAFT_48563 [Mycena epipterygia]
MNFGRAGKLSNLEIALMMGNLNPTSTTRPCTQCNREVPKTQRLLTCDKCRASKKQQKARKKERDMAIKEGRGANGFSSAPLLAVIAKQEQETAAKRASRKGGAKAKAADSSTAESSAAGSSPASSSNPRNMGMVFQAILNEHQRDSAAAAAPKKKAVTKVATAKGSAGSGGAGTKRKLSDVEANEPGAVYDAETAKKRLRGDMPMPKLEPIPGSQVRCRVSASPVAR